jgi:hypothetical protein
MPGILPQDLQLPSRKFPALGVTCTQGIFQTVMSCPGIDLITAGKEVDGSIAILRPGVDGQVGFGYYNNPADAMRYKHPEDGIDNRRSGSKGSFFHGTFNKVHIVQYGRIAMVEFYEYMPAQ